MIELKGKHNIAKVFTDNIDQETISQVIELLNQPFITGSQIRIMPDCHAGKGCVVGTTMTLTDKVVPNLVGVDIGCGMLATKLEETEINLEKLDEVINTQIPSGFNIHDQAKTDFDGIDKFVVPINTDNALKSLGTLGGGNHFIEIDQDGASNLWLVIHSGSRHLGIEVCDHYQRRGISALRKEHIEDKIKTTIAKLKAEGKERDIENTIKIIKMQHQSIPDALCYVSDSDFDG